MLKCVFFNNPDEERKEAIHKVHENTRIKSETERKLATERQYTASSDSERRSIIQCVKNCYSNDKFVEYRFFIQLWKVFYSLTRTYVLLSEFRNLRGVSVLYKTWRIRDLNTLHL